MISKVEEKAKAIQLRKKGLSYNEILQFIPVAKSTLSLWLESVRLAKRHKQRLTGKRIAAALRGAQTKRNHRLAITEEIKNKAKSEVGKLSNRELWLIGAALYWAEGSKQKDHDVSAGVKFSNSDPMMIKVFLEWLQDICKIPESEITFRIALHKSAKHKLNKVKKYWATITNFSINNFQKIDWKKNKINTKRKNIGEKYFGLLNIRVKNSTNLNRKIDGWIKGICEQCGDG